MKNRWLILILCLVIFLSGGLLLWKSFSNEKKVSSNEKAYNPVITQNNFISIVSNPYFTLSPGASYAYRTVTADGTEKIEVTVTGETKVVMGVTTIVARDRSWMNDVIVEDTHDYYAEDKAGNVWYFGEAVDNYENGKLKNHSGSWESGVDGAQPGIIMEANPKVGDSYRQEYYRGQAEDMADIVSVVEAVTVPIGNYNNCLKTRDWSPLEPSVIEYKFYCPGIKNLVTEITGNEKTELVNVANP